ncbi:MAG: SRPBCC family protein [Gemmatimonadota bacterium]
MKWVILVAGVIVGIGLLMVVIGLLLPRNHIATSQVELKQPIDSVWATVRALGDTPSFWPELKSASRMPDVEGKETWGQTMKNGFNLPLVIDEERPPNLLVTRIVAKHAPFGGVWRYSLEPVNSGTRITVTEDGWVSNPMFRVISRLMGHHTTLDSYLKGLSRKFGEETVPTHKWD